MKFMISEGRAICLLEKEDATQIHGRPLPDIDLLIVPHNIRDHIENSHIWTKVFPKVRKGLQNVIYF